jgi:hypothetical protein
MTQCPFWVYTYTYMLHIYIIAARPLSADQPVPNNDVGFGSVVLRDVLSVLFASDRGSFTHAHVHVARHMVCVSVPSEEEEGGGEGGEGGVSVRATLAWSDAPATVNTGTSAALVNDLDLTLIEFAAPHPPLARTRMRELQTTRGNERGGGRRSDSNADRRNNVEQATLHTSGGNSVVCVVIKAHKIKQGPQAYSVVISTLSADTTPAQPTFIRACEELPRSQQRAMHWPCVDGRASVRESVVHELSREQPAP